MTTIKLSRRSANYSKAELNCLVKYLEENPELVSVKLGGKYQTADDFRLAWEELADKISAVGGFFGSRRTGQEIKRKWSDLKSRVKAKAASLAIEADKSEGENTPIRLTPVEERVLAIISRDLEEQSQRIDTAHGSKWPLVKVFSFPHESNSEDKIEIEYGSAKITDDGFHNLRDEGDENVEESANEPGLLDEIKLGSNNDKKRRISEAFSSSGAEKKPLGLKKLRITSEEEQLQALCNSQLEVNAELRMIKDILKKTQQSVEKIAILKRAELRLKCAKYGVEFEDLFD